jgi:hypothetical protein
LKVFVSSTVYDLIDVRAEVAEHLRSLAITPVMSDDKTSGFEVAHDTNSIQTCLINLESCDEVIAILDRRYGATLGGRGFEDVSATHLEMKHALAKNKTLRVYVRDRLEADFATWKKNKRSNEVALPWVSEADRGLLKVLDDFSYLRSDDTPNWYTTFQDSRDLKADLTKYFGPKLVGRQLAEAIADNRFPMMVVGVDYEVRESGMYGLTALVTAKIRNVSNTVAFNFNTHWSRNPAEKPVLSVFPSFEVFTMSYLAKIVPPSSTAGGDLIVTYDSILGVSVVDRFHVAIKKLPGNVLASTGKLVDRQYRLGNAPTIEVLPEEHEKTCNAPFSWGI